MSARFIFALSLLICLAEASPAGAIRKTWEWTPERRLAERLTEEERASCRGSDEDVAGFCATWGPYWAEWDEAPADVSLQQNCEIDNVTKEMHCKMQGFCQGGHVQESDIDFLSYPCGNNCRGSLLLDCCNKCLKYKMNPRSLGVNGVACSGCEPEDIAKAADEANCFFTTNKFKCVTVDKCHLGSPSQFEKRCNIIPCDKCSSESLRGQCCQDCVWRQCHAQNGMTRLVCKGCNVEAASSSSSSPFWVVVLVLLFCVAPIVVIGGYLFVSNKRRSEEADE